MEINWTEIENKWRSKWIANKDFETNPNEKQKKFITVAYPYPNSPQHIGHGRTYTLADVHARFYRMKGFNVLFPMAFHYTGTPILGMAKRVEAGDAELIENLKNLYSVPEESIKTFVEPVKIADYFHEEIKTGMIEMGYSIDWRREFTTIDPVYSKFIEWQINTLREKNLIVQGNHPVGWCPKDQNPVSQHDTQGDVEPDFTEYILIKFKYGDYIIPTATLRPETIFGVVNLWVNPEIVYKKITVDNEKWIVSAECAYKIEFLDKKITYDGEINGSELVGETVTVPHREESIVMLPASFVESKTGTGMVMSVPAHAPFDYQALEDIKKTNLEADLASKVNKITPISIIETEGYGENPAKEAVEKFSVTSQNDPKLEEATKEVYGKEFYGGKLKSNTEQFSGIKVAYAKDTIKEWLIENKHADILLELTNASIKCRCGAECVVKVLNNQWFLNYGDKEWKELATKCFDQMNILPQEIRSEFQYVIGWLHERACARQHGLGTKLPWDKDWIVESLSDSVIYMAYYTISKFVNNGTIAADNLSKEFFDYVFLDKGDVNKVSEITKMSADIINEIKKEFQYFYPVDSRHSGRDLVPNHLTFFVLNHVAIFPESNWPKEIVVNGSVLMNGSKMSKSMGNIIPLRKAIQDYGADPIRLAIIISAELLQDADFNMESVSGIQNKLESLFHECSRLKPEKIENLEAEDRWILSKSQSMVSEVTAAIEKMRLREALHDILFAFESDLSWYNKRVKAKNRQNISGILHQINSIRVAMLSPFAPHIAEEMWEKLGHSEMVSTSAWPEFSTESLDANAIQSEELLKSTIDDVANILKVTKITPQKITIYTADSFKSKIYHSILEKVMAGQTNMGIVMKELIANPETADVKKIPDFVQKTIKDILSEPTGIRETKLQSKEFDEKEFLANELPSLGKKEFGVEIDVFSESDDGIYDPKGKARHARPFKPAILIE
ncbi:leucine--tRNA ligase [Nitrosopumilus ureiphilus]|uniref:Leucine--tRNA ligase n=1 Tax=Nitrosopumilus ureiphilus TaxID=1470067 RepID=A0A7D5R5C4_9ARCH|nr:leucine--tRNA ligase [Nitrosopumilus ureiphilus]QLH06077.1 leucine--tRNA ligase [Nitrosopumilus ureiphilus]